MVKRMVFVNRCAWIKFPPTPPPHPQWGPFYKNWLAFVPVWVSNYNHYEVWDGIIYPFSRKYIFTECIITHPDPNFKVGLSITVSFLGDFDFISRYFFLIKFTLWFIMYNLGHGLYTVKDDKLLCSSQKHGARFINRITLIYTLLFALFSQLPRTFLVFITVYSFPLK